MGREVIVSIAFLLLCLLGLGLGDPKLVLDDEVKADQYSAFVTDLRNQLGSTERVQDIPVLPEKVPDAQRFVQATLRYGGDSVTLGIDVTNLYLCAYRIPPRPTEKKWRSYFFLDQIWAKTYLFNKTQQVDLPFKSNYGSLGGQGVDLGIHALRDAVKVLGKDGTTAEKKKKKLVVIIQMVCEAARFNHIEEKIRESIDPGGKYIVIESKGAIMKTIMELEKNWDTLSTAVRNADSKGQLKEAVKIGDKELGDVDAVKEYLAVMKNKNR